MLILDTETILLDCEASSREEAIRLAAGLLRQQGCIGEQYAEDVLAREADYPTGLPCDEAFVAIPHALSSDVKRTGVGVLRLKTPVPFCNMANDEETLPVELVFLLANASDGGSHLDDLQELMDCFSRVGLLEDLKKAQTPRQFADVFAARDTYPEA